MVYNPRVPPDESLDRFRRVVEAALDELENRRQEVNDLNVFPVADGDTGDNMALTMRAVVEELNALDGAARSTTIGRDEIVSAVARAALLGARGNSGVILSQIVRGAAEELASRPGELVDPVLVSAALRARGRRGVRVGARPGRGHDALRRARDGAAAWLTTSRTWTRSGSAPRPPPRSRTSCSPRCSSTRSRPARRPSSAGPSSCAVLRESGVVDAGAYGLTVIVAGCLGGAARRWTRRSSSTSTRRRRSTGPSTSRRASATARTSPSPASASTPDTSRRCSSGSATPCWWWATTARCACTCTPTSPSRAVALFDSAGEVSRFDVADMHEQVAERSARLGGDGAEAPSAPRARSWRSRAARA